MRALLSALLALASMGLSPIAGERAIPTLVLPKVCFDYRPAEIELLARAITRHEGTEETLPTNPGALVFAGQPGAVVDRYGYAEFETRDQGDVALRADLWAKVRLHWTLERIMDAWGDGSYLGAVIWETGLAAETVIEQETTCR